MLSCWVRRAGVGQRLDFGIRQAGGEVDGELAARGQMGAS